MVSLFQTFNHRRDGRTYAQFLSDNSKPQITFPSQNNLNTRIVVIRKNANARLVIPFKVGMSTPSNVLPGIKDCKSFSKNASTKSSKQDTLLTLQNRFEVLQQISDNSMHFIPLEHCTKVAHTNRKTQVQEIPKMTKNQINVTQISREAAPL